VAVFLKEKKIILEKDFQLNEKRISSLDARLALSLKEIMDLKSKYSATCTIPGRNSLAIQHRGNNLYRNSTILEDEKMWKSF
jgi:hypothetical protein